MNAALAHMPVPWITDSERDRMRDDFLEAHGWKNSQRSHRTPLLLRRPRSRPEMFGGSTFDHHEIFTCAGRPVAYATHPYGYRPELIESVCAGDRLKAFIYNPAQSWYYPFRTHMIVLVREEDAAEFARIERLRLARPWCIRPQEFLSGADTRTTFYENPFSDMALGHESTRGMMAAATTAKGYSVAVAAEWRERRALEKAVG